MAFATSFPVFQTSFVESILWSTHSYRSVQTKITGWTASFPCLQRPSIAALSYLFVHCQYIYYAAPNTFKLKRYICADDVI